ncbi:MAG: hypothetical protein LBV45_05640, partial [Xanthomonadaceae bacterium]|nr:hypothetical protein [Xanthomonadaceae bacterium]
DAAQSLLQTIIDRYKEYGDSNDDKPSSVSVAATASAAVPPVTGSTISFANTGMPASVSNANVERADNANGSKVRGKTNGNDAGVSTDMETSRAPQSEALSLIELICLRFNTVSRQLRDRHNHRPSLEIEDEYDVQDLFLALLKLHFPDARSEEWTPGYAAGSSKRNSLIESAGIVVDVKKTSSSLKPSDLRMQISTDLLHYSAQPYCKMLVCFIYDPEGRIGNPEAMEKELEALSAQLPLKIIIAPKGA